MAELTQEQKLALDHARHLAENGVPVFVAPADASRKIGFRLPTQWQQLAADPDVVDRWEPGMALGAVMGHTVDAVDADLHKGGADSLAGLVQDGRMPVSYGRQSTPSGGTHDLVATMGVRSRDNTLPGMDVKAGDENGGGRGFIFLAPTEKPSKITGELGTYRWVKAPDLDGLTLVGGDATGTELASLVRSRQSADEPAAAPYDGPIYSDLTRSQRAEVDSHVDNLLEGWRSRLEAAREWSDGEADEYGRGWEALSYQFAWSLAKIVAAPWSGLDADTAHERHDAILPSEMAADEKCRGKWDSTLLAKAAARTVEDPPFAWADFGPVEVEEPGQPEASPTGILGTFARMSMAELLDPNKPPREFVVEPMIAAGTSVALVAPAGHRKSLLLLGMALAVARGDDMFAGMEIPKARRVMYIDMENTEDDLRDRLTSFGVAPGDNLERFILVSLPSMLPLDTKKGGEELLQAIAAYGLEKGDLVVLDSYQRVTEAGENDSDTTRGYYRHTGALLKALGLTVIRTDNTGKDVTRGARGSSGKRDDVDVEYLVKSDGDYIEVNVGKVRQRGVTQLVFTVRTTEAGQTTFTSDHQRPVRHDTQACIALLDKLAVPDDAGERKASSVLDENTDQRFVRNVVREACKVRQERREQARRDFRRGGVDGDRAVSDGAVRRGQVAN